MLKSIILLATLFFTNRLTWAAPDVPDFPASSTGLATKINTFGDTIATYGQTMAQSTVGVSASIAFAFGVCAIVLSCLQFARASDADEAMQGIIEDLIYIAVFATFAIDYSLYTYFTDGVRKLFEIVNDILVTGSGFQKGTMLEPFFEPIRSVITTWENLDLDIFNFFPFLIYLLVLFLSAFTLFAAAAQIVMFFIMGKLLVAIALVFGPISFAAGVWDKTRPMLSKWFEFFQIACIYQVVCTVVIFIIGKAIQIAAQTIPRAGGSTLDTFDSLFMYFLLAGASLQVAAQIPSIASAMLPGHLSIKGAQLGMGKSAQDAGNNVMKNTAKDTAKLTIGGIGKLLGKG